MSKAAIIVILAFSVFLVFIQAGGEKEQNGLEKRRSLKRAHQELNALKNDFKLLRKRMKKLESKKARGWCRDGTPGAAGIPGKPGKDGRDGSQGSPGPRGRDGRDGQHGAPGPRGIPGLKGTPGIQGPRGPPGPKSSGVQYVRWGRTSCPSGANLVYKGRVGGESYNHPGGGSNYVCLTESPKYWRYSDSAQTSGYMYGAEYQTSQSYNPFSNMNPHDHDVPCVVCFVPNRNAKLMIPATYECPAGWSKEYWGYLMAAHYNHPNQKDFICVDQSPEVIKGTKADLNGALLYTIEGRCGSLPCLPYVARRELTCTVCTK